MCPLRRPARHTRPDMSSRCAHLWVVAAAAVLAAACGEEPPEVEPVAVGAGSTVEQRVLAALAVAALEQADVPVEVVADLGDTRGVRRAALRGDVDVFWDYTGAAWGLGLAQQAPPADPEESYERVRREDEQRNGLRWLTPTAANATLALVVPASSLPPEGQQRGMTWLAGELSRGGRRLCADPDFLVRPSGYAAFADAYAIDRGAVALTRATEAEAIAAVAEGRCDAGLATATSGAARAAGLVPVADDLEVFPAFVVAPVVREEAATTPALVAALDAVTGRIDTARLAELNAAVEGGADPGALARELVAATPEEAAAPPAAGPII